jgi:hypothetical protein
MPGVEIFGKRLMLIQPNLAIKLQSRSVSAPLKRLRKMRSLKLKSVKMTGSLKLQLLLLNPFQKLEKVVNKFKILLRRDLRIFQQESLR